MKLCFYRLTLVLRTKLTDTTEKGFCLLQSKLQLSRCVIEDTTAITRQCWCLCLLTTEWWTQPCRWTAHRGNVLSSNSKIHRKRTILKNWSWTPKQFFLRNKPTALEFSTISMIQIPWMKWLRFLIPYLISLFVSLCSFASSLSVQAWVPICLTNRKKLAFWEPWASLVIELSFCTSTRLLSLSWLVAY